MCLGHCLATRPMKISLPHSRPGSSSGSTLHMPYRDAALRISNDRNLQTNLTVRDKSHPSASPLRPGPPPGNALSLTQAMAHADRLARIVVNPAIFGGKPIIRGHCLAVEHVLDMLAAGDDIDTIVDGYAWMEREDVLACIEYARRLVGHERIEPLVIEPRTA
jgi:uncharacterized protein (DUF433 family)